MFLPFEAVFAKYATFDQTVRREMYRQTLLFVFRLSTNKVYCDYLKSLNPSVAPSELRAWIRDEVVGNGYLMMNVKHWLYHVVANDLDPVDAAPEFGIQPAHVKMHMLLDGQLRAGLEGYVAADHPALDLATTQKLSDRVWHRNREFVTKFAWRKLRFVCTQRGDDVEDMVAELMEEGLRALRHNWPCYPSELYCDNLFKRTAHNYGINQIEKVTTQKHARLVANGDGFMSLTVNIEAANRSSETAADPNLVSDLHGKQIGAQDLDLQISVARYFSHLSPKKQQMMQSLSHYVPEFTEWLKQNRHVSGDEDNEHLRDRAPLDWYTRLAAQWLQVDHEKVWSFVSDLRHDFAAYAH